MLHEPNNYHVNMYDVMSGSWVVRWKCMFTTFLFMKQTLFVQHIHSTWHVGWASIDVVYWYGSLPGFLIHFFVYYYLSTLMSFKVFCLHSCPFPCGWFFACCSSCMFWLSLLLSWVTLFEYDCRLFLIWPRMASSGSVCLFVLYVVLLGNICNPLLLSSSAWYIVCYM